MFLQSLTWIPRLWGLLVGQFIAQMKGVERALPDDVIIDILSRLPTDLVLECRRVCRQWRRLTSTPYFAELHLKRVTPDHFVQCSDLEHICNRELGLFIFNNDAKKNTRIARICVSSTHLMKRHRPFLIGSCNGLLLFEAFMQTAMFFVFNPITKEQITLFGPAYRGNICGFFFHPSTGEYKLLYVRRQANFFQYYMRTLGNKRWKRLTSFYYLPVFSAPAVIVNGSLYWMVKKFYTDRCPPRISSPPCNSAIMLFSMDSEYFRIKPQPGIKCHSRQRHEEMHLLEMKEHLSFCHLQDKVVDIWVLEDYATWGWIKRYNINLDWDVNCYPFDRSNVNDKIQLLNFQNGELLLGWFSRGFFWYNLELNTVRKIGKTGIKMLGSLYYYSSATTCCNTLVPLSDFPSDLTLSNWYRASMLGSIYLVELDY